MKINRLGSDVEKLYPYSAMLDQCQKFGRYGLYMASLFFPLSLAVSDAVVKDEQRDTKRNVDVSESDKLEEQLVKRVDGLFDDMKRLGYL